MPNTLIQPSFARGELTPELHRRIDLATYAIGAETVDNMIVLSRGGLQSRTGTQFIGESKTSAKACRLVDFVYSNEQAYTLEFGDYYMRVIKDGGYVIKDISVYTTYNAATAYNLGDWCKSNGHIYQALQASTNKYPSTNPDYWILSDAYELTTPYAVADIWKMKFEQSADILYIVCDGYAPIKVTRSGHASWSGSYCDFIGGPLRDENTDSGIALTVAGSVQIARPASDISAGTYWTYSTGSHLYTCIDEVTPSDTDYIYNNNTAADTCEVKFSSLVDPLTDKGHVFRIRIDNSSSTQGYYITAGIYCGATEIATFTVGIPPTTSNEWDMPILDFDAAKITDYTDLRVKLTSPHSAVRVSWCELQVPMVTGGTATSKTDVPLYEGDSVTITSSASLFNSGHVGSVWGIRYIGNSKSINFYTPGASVFETQPIPIDGEWAINFDPNDSHPQDNQDLYIEKTVDNGASWTRLKTISASASTSAIEYTGSEDEPCYFRITREYAVTSDTDISKVSASTTGKQKWAYFKITAYTSATEVTATLQTDFDRTGVSFATWAEGQWSAYRGYPTAISFFQNRLCFGKLNQFAMSKVDDYENFTKSIPQVADDAITNRIPGRMVNDIQWMVPTKSLIVLTSDSEWTITAGQDGSFAFDSMKIDQQSFYGCDGQVEPVILGDTVIFLQRNGRKVRSIGYDYSSDGYKGNEISIAADHLFDGYTIVDWAFQANPNSILWCVRSDGDLLSLTFQKEQEILAWTHHTTDGNFESVCCIPSTTQDDLYLLANRTISAATKRYVEMLAHRDVSVKQNYFGVDCGLTYSGAAATTISGLSHLEGKVVDVLADGVRLSKTVTSGAITLAVAAVKVHVGLPFDYTFKSLSLDMNNSADKKKLINEVTVCMINSAGGTIGQTTMRELLKDTATLEAKKDSKISITATWDKYGQFSIKGDGVLPMHVVAVLPRATLGGV